jgi:small subunit ribosomal protein S6
MMRYETLFLTVPEFTNDEFSALESSINKTIQDSKGVMISCERWGKYRLAYPIDRNDYGIYGLVRFELEGGQKQEALESLKTLLKIKHGDSVVRCMTVALDPQASLTYNRPESLEEAPVRDVDSFLKENKMEGLRSKKRAIEPEEPVEEEEEIEEDEESSEEEEQQMGDTAVAAAAATPPSEGN